MSELDFTKGEEVVYCPTQNIMRSVSIWRGAQGTIISRQVGKTWTGKKPKSVLVKWKSHRKGVSCFRIRGTKRPKSDWCTAIYISSLQKRKKYIHGNNPRFEEEANDIHPLSYCSECPLRLRRLATPCSMPKAEAIATDGLGYPKSASCF